MTADEEHCTNSQRQRFERRKRLLKSEQFRTVFNQRCSVGDDRLVMYAMANELDHARLGLAVGKKLGGAVVRNRWKRVLREAFRLHQSELPTGVDLVVIPRVGTQPELAPLERSLVSLARRARRKLDRSKNG